MKDKMELIKKYIDIQSDDEDIWFRPETINEEILQDELRRLCWMIEEATPRQIEHEIRNR